MGMAVERLAAELIQLPLDTRDRVHATHAQDPVGEPRFTPDASWDEVSERLVHSQTATDANT
jgi:hypothetical protein